MKLAQKQAIYIFLTSFLILTLAIGIIYHNNYNTIIENNLDLSLMITDEISNSLENNILEKVNTVKALSLSPLICEALKTSNDHYNRLPKEQRNIEINSKNEKWMSISDPEHEFILSYTNNNVSKYLKRQQENIKDEFGEIFITDKYGAIISSTTKLTTLAHGSKYWWKGAYNKGNGAVFLDDRGFDESVGNYVLGIVIPIIKENEIVGILKANVNILGSINKLILNRTKMETEEIILARSNGLIVFQEGIEPLSKKIPEQVLTKLSTISNSFQLKDKHIAGIYAASEIDITNNKPGYKFGGSFQSPDHKKGNTGESWLVLDFIPISHISQQVNNELNILILTGLFLSAILAVISLMLGNWITKPIKDLTQKTVKISKGDFDSKIIANRNDEIGKLASAFNRMTEYLREKTTSIELLNTEVDKRKENEQALRMAAKKWQITFDASQDIIMVLDEERTIMQINSAATKLFKIASDEIINKKCYSIVHKSSKPISNCPFRKAKSSLKREFMELEIDSQWLEITVDPILDENNRFIGAVHFIRDITDRKAILKEIETKSTELENQLQNSEKQRIATLVILNDLNKTTKKLKAEIQERKLAEIALKENQSHLTSIIQNPVGYMIYRLKAGPDPLSPTVTHVSPSICDMTGISMEDSKDYSNWFQDIYPEDLPRLIEANARGMKPPFIFNEEFRYNHPTRGLIWLSVKSNGIPYKNDPDNIEWAHGIITDITARKQAELKAQIAQNRIKKMNEELERKVLERTRQLEKSNKELEAFSYSVSHDLRAPLRAINGFTKILLEDYGSCFDQEGRNITSIIIDNALKMGYLIDDLLTFSRLGKASLRYSNIDMNHLVQSVFLDNTDAEKRKRLDFRVKNLDNVHADKSLLKIVWTNLISNAIKFSDNQETAIIEVFCTSDDQNICYHIKDNGAGFDMKFVDKLFGVFQRLHKDDEFSGTGVGLALVKRIIIQHKGQIWANSEINQGAQFSFSLPKI